MNLTLLHVVRRTTPSGTSQMQHPRARARSVRSRNLDITPTTVGIGIQVAGSSFLRRLIWSDHLTLRSRWQKVHLNPIPTVLDQPQMHVLPCNYRDRQFASSLSAVKSGLDAERMFELVII